MVMLSDILTKSRRQHLSSRTSAVKAPNMPERVRIWEYDMRNGEGLVWDATMPRHILIDELSVACRYSPDYFRYRLFAGAIFALGVFLMGLVAALLTIGIPMAFFPPMLLAVLGFGVGYLLGPKVAPPPFWAVRRLWHEDGLIEVLPLVHTHLEGPSPKHVIFGASNGKVPPRLKVIGIDDSDVADDVYIPIVPRATTLYQDLKMLEEAAEFAVPRDKWDKIQIGGLLLLAGGLILGLIFLMAITTTQ